MSTRDYRHFSTVAKTAFAKVARPLGYTPAGSTLFVRPHPAGWHEAFWLDSGWSGGDTFAIGYGIIAADITPARTLREAPLLLDEPLRNAAGARAFSRASRAQIAQSAEAFARLYPQQAVPWFDRFRHWQDIVCEFARRRSQWLDETRLGDTDTFSGVPTLYGLLLARAGDNASARRWLVASQRQLHALPRRNDEENALLALLTRTLDTLPA